jgi:hypothetical protein
MDQCFFTAIWQRPTNDTQAGATCYRVSLNGNFKLNKPVADPSYAEFSASLQDTYEIGCMIGVTCTAGSICGTDHLSCTLWIKENVQN